MPEYLNKPGLKWLYRNFKHGFYVFDTSNLGDVTTFVIQTNSGSKTTLELASTKAEIEELRGKIIQVTENSANIEILAQKDFKIF